jgi:hypothetical protein
MKEAYRVKVAKYAIAKKIASMPGFQWWVPHTIRKKDCILKMLQKRVVKQKNQKFGIKVPKPMDVRRA